jgi:hypothetical protein
MDWVFLAAGALVLALALWDIFQSIVVPRPTPGRFRLARYVIPPSWRAWRWLGLRKRDGLARDTFLGLFAPGAAVLLLVLWVATLVLGYGLVLFGLRAEIRPSPPGLLEAMYFAGTSLLTLGFGEILAGGAASRFVVLVAAMTGLGVVALVITFLFSLFANYQRREVKVVALSARAKSPPSAVTLLVTYAHLGMVDELPALFREWEDWTAEVLDSHVAYPLLGYFRSSHDNISWISALGAVLDAAALVVTTIKGVPRGHAELTKRIGAHLVEDIANVLRLEGDGGAVDLDAFRDVYNRLASAGYEVEPIEKAWHRFEQARGTYAGRLEAMAAFWATPATSWVGHRTPSGSVLHAAAPARAAQPPM